MEQIILSTILKTLKIEINEIPINFGYGSIPQWDSIAHVAIVSELVDMFPRKIFRSRV